MKLPLLVHAHTKKQLEQYLVSPVHAVGLSGEVGAGKGHVASYLCARLLDTSINATDQHPYVHKINALEHKTGIDDIRALQKFLTLTVPGSHPIKRIVILEYIDMLGHEAQNALLKTLEEPPTDTVIIVTYAHATRILPTIHSRMQSVQIQPVGQTEARHFFQDYPTEEFAKSFSISDGQAGLLNALLQDRTDHPLIKAINQAREVIGLPRYQRLAKVDAAVKNNDLPVSLLLDGLYRLVDASYRQSLKSKQNKELQATVTRLGLVEQAINDLDQNVQAKLVMSRLFMAF